MPVEDFAPTLAASQSVGVVDGVPGLVTKNAHEPARITSLYLTHDVPLEFFESRVRKVERYGDSRDAVR